MFQKRDGESPLSPHRAKLWYPDIQSHQQKGGQRRRLSQRAIEEIEERTRELRREIFGKQRIIRDSEGGLERKG